MKKKNIILIILGILLLSLLIYLITRPEKLFKVIELEKNNYVLNRSEKNYLDTITYVGLNELGIQGITIIIRDIEEKKIIDGDYDTKGYLVSQPNGGNSYMMFIKKGINRNTAIDIISHELIHVQQYHSKDLTWLGGSDMLWRGEEYLDIDKTIPYMERGWEQDAFNLAPILKEDISNQLYE